MDSTASAEDLTVQILATSASEGTWPSLQSIASGGAANGIQAHAAPAVAVPGSHVPAAMEVQNSAGGVTDMIRVSESGTPPPPLVMDVSVPSPLASAMAAVTTINPLVTPSRPISTSSQSLHGSSMLSDSSSPASALMNAVHEELRSLASQLTSPEPDVQQIRHLHSILTEALRRQADAPSGVSSPSRHLAGNLASVAATHCVRMMTFNLLPPAPTCATPVPPSHLADGGPSPVSVVSAQLPFGGGGGAATPSVAEPATSAAATSTGKRAPVRTPVRTNTGGRIPHGTLASDEAQELYLKSDPMLMRVEDGNGDASARSSAAWRYRCRQCHVLFDQRRELEAHFSEHRTPSKSWICHVCGKTFTRADHLNRHSQSHDLPEFICQICGCAFSRCSFLDRHWRLAHGNVTAVPSVVQQTVKRPSELPDVKPPAKQKRVTHSESSIDVGGGSVKSAPAVATSLATVAASHIADLEVRAAVLAEAIATSGSATSGLVADDAAASMAGHPSSGAGAPAAAVASDPQRPRPMHPCPLCDKVFVRFDHMLRHKRVHTGEKPFFCALCAKRYTRADYLREHIVSQHNTTNVKCKICHTVFPYVTLYRTHICGHGEVLRNWYMQGEFLDQGGNVIQPCLVIGKNNGSLDDAGGGGFADMAKDSEDMPHGMPHVDAPPESCGLAAVAPESCGMPALVPTTTITTASGIGGNTVTICALPVVSLPGGSAVSMLSAVASMAGGTGMGAEDDGDETTTVHVEME